MPRTGENIYKRKDGRWEGRCIVGRGSDNKALYRSFYGLTYSEVKRKIEDFKKNQSLLKASSKHDFEYYGNLWLNIVSNEHKYSTYIKYYSLLKNHILPRFKSLRIYEITTAMVQEFIDEKLLKGRIDGKSGLSGKTVNGIVSVIHLITSYACEQGVKLRH